MKLPILYELRQAIFVFSGIETRRPQDCPAARQNPGNHGTRQRCHFIFEKAEIAVADAEDFNVIGAGAANYGANRCVQARTITTGCYNPNSHDEQFVFYDHCASRGKEQSAKDSKSGMSIENERPGEISQPLILAIETATRSGSVAVTRGEQVLS